MGIVEVSGFAVTGGVEQLFDFFRFQNGDDHVSCLQLTFQVTEQLEEIRFAEVHLWVALQRVASQLNGLQICFREFGRRVVSNLVSYVLDAGYRSATRLGHSKNAAVAAARAATSRRR